MMVRDISSQSSDKTLIQRQHRADNVSPCSLEAYAAYSGMSASLLRSAHRLPQAMLKRELDRRQFKQIDSLGSLVHEVFLEDLNLNDLVVLPSRLESTRAEFRAEKAAFCSEHKAQGHRVVAESLLEAVQRGSDALLQHDEACALRAECLREQTILWYDATWGLECKARLDLMGDDQVWDLKCLRSAAREGELRQTKARMGFGLQLWWYERALLQLGKQALRRGYILLDTQCWSVQIHEVSEADQKIAAEQAKKAMELWGSSLKAPFGSDGTCFVV